MAVIYNQSNGDITFTYFEGGKEFNHTVYQGENDDADNPSWWGTTLTNFTGCIQLQAPGGGNQEQMTVTSDTAPALDLGVGPPGPMALLQNNSGVEVVWAYDYSGTMYGGNLLGIDFAPANFSNKATWVGFYLTGFSGLVVVPSTDGNVTKGYVAQLTAEPSQDDQGEDKKDKKHKP